MRFENVWLRHQRRSPWVLQAVDLTLDSGQVAVVLGRNGVGKSTLLAAAAGLLNPGRGRIVDRPARVGFVPERFPARQPFTVGGYLVGMARVHGLSRDAAAEQVDQWCERLALAGYLDAHLSELSKGSAQKVGLIQAMIPRPDLLVLDEPWEGLDAETRALIPEIVGEILAVGGSVLVSDHLGEVARLPGALRWHVGDNRVDPYQVSSDASVRYVLEVSVAAAEVPHVVGELRELGHEVLRVRAPRELPPLAIEPPPPPPSREIIPWHDPAVSDGRAGEVVRHSAPPAATEHDFFGWETRR